MYSERLTRWIEDNIDLIDELQIDELWGKCPAELYAELYAVLEDAGVDITERNDDQMWGIKSSDGRYTLSIGKHNKVNYNVNHTSSQGMRGGMQIGFKSLADCLKFLPEAEKRYPHIRLRPSKMQKRIVDSYTWTEVETIYGRCYITNLAIDAYDPVISKQRIEQERNKKKLHAEFVSLWENKIKSIIDRQAISDSIDERFGKIVISIFFYMEYKELGIKLSVPYSDSKINDVIDLLRTLIPVAFDVQTNPNSLEESTIWLNFKPSTEYQEIKSQVYGN